MRIVNIVPNFVKIATRIRAMTRRPAFVPTLVHPLRDTTERPVTVTHGTNRIIGRDPGQILNESLQTLAHPPRPAGAPPLWDGCAAERIVEILDACRHAKGFTPA